MQHTAVAAGTVAAKPMLLVKDSDAGCDIALQQLMGQAKADHAAAHDQHIAGVVTHCGAGVPCFRRGQGEFFKAVQATAGLMRCMYGRPGGPLHTTALQRHEHYVHDRLST